jgi:hypothetical protein
MAPSRSRPRRTWIGVIDDLAFEWVGDFGTPGPDRGLGGHYLVVPHDYDGPLPDGGFVIYHAKTTHVIIVGRAFLVDGRPEPAAENIKANLRIGPYVPGAYGTSLGSFLSGQAPMRPVGPLPSPRFVDGTKLALETIPPADPTYFDRINEVVQAQPAGFLAPEIAGQLAAIGIVKGNEFHRPIMTGRSLRTPPALPTPRRGSSPTANAPTPVSPTTATRRRG